ncbi:MAG: undecaprenyl phosphate translocase family protein [Planctomycetota bacterium]|jgi:putative membrane protein
MDEPRLATLGIRSALGGALMGLANLVPGISGGTMLLAAGVYQRFIDGIAEVTTLRFRRRSLFVLGVIACSAVAVIVLLAGVFGGLVANHRWIMYSIFIGLTLGGVPLVWRLARPVGPTFWGGAVVGLAVMAAMAFTTAAAGGDRDTTLLFLAGVAGASAMVLPGVSGAYLLLVLGQYESILNAVDLLKERDFGAAMPVVIPVGVGVAVGIVGISNLIRWALQNQRAVTLGFLLGLLLGSVLGIYPFQLAVARGEPRAYFTPTALQVMGSIGLILAGYGLTRLIDKVGAK